MTNRLRTPSRFVCAAALGLVAAAPAAVSAAPWAVQAQPEAESSGLSEARAEAFVAEAAAEAARRSAPALQAEIEAEVIRVGDREMRLLSRTFGERPDAGHSLYISMHGGGGTAARVNDGQWQNQIGLYEPEEGIVVAPRAPTDTWNMWHQGHIDPLFERLIAAYVATGQVDPNRVYLLGYSAGGDGAYQVAPRFADRLAAASMMAGHPNDASPLGLYNLPFAIFMGANDGAYDRNKKAAEWRDTLAELQQEHPGAYEHFVRIYDGLGHWMNLKDAEALPWMAKHTRDPWPENVVWQQDDVTHDRFYWLAVEPGTAQKGDTVRASVEGQTITLTTEGVNAVRLRLRDGLVDLDEAITVVMNGERVFEGTVPRTRGAIERSLEERLDAPAAATAELTVRSPSGS